MYVKYANSVLDFTTENTQFLKISLVYNESPSAFHCSKNYHVVTFSCLDGKLEYNPSTNSCQNVYLQRYLGKKLHVAQSDIAG